MSAEIVPLSQRQPRCNCGLCASHDEYGTTAEIVPLPTNFAAAMRLSPVSDPRNDLEI
jgi:hypothetical protein